VRLKSIALRRNNPRHSGSSLSQSSRACYASCSQRYTSIASGSPASTSAYRRMAANDDRDFAELVDAGVGYTRAWGSESLLLRRALGFDRHPLDLLGLNRLVARPSRCRDLQHDLASVAALQLAAYRRLGLAIYRF
jgi:hypothetical protein